MRVVLLRDYRGNKCGESLVVPTNEGDWLIRTEIACDPTDYARIMNKRIEPMTIKVPKIPEPKSFGEPLEIDQTVVDKSIRDAKKATKKIADRKE